MNTRINLSQNGNTPFERLIGHNRLFLEKWSELENTLFKDSHLDAHLLEQVRRTLAFENECEYCMVKAGRPDFNKNDEKIVVAVAFALMFATDHKTINEAYFKMLKKKFTEQQIAELCVFICFITASQKLGKIMNLTETLQQVRTTSMEALSKFKKA